MIVETITLTTEQIEMLVNSLKSHMEIIEMAMGTGFQYERGKFLKEKTKEIIKTIETTRRIVAEV